MANDMKMAGTTARTTPERTNLENASRRMKAGFSDAHDLKSWSDDFGLRLDAAMQRHRRIDI